LPVALYEAAGVAGGRCRSYFDRELGCRLDNGNHLLLSGNDAALAYLASIGASGTLTGSDQPNFDFADLGTREHWTLRLSRGHVPWWVLDSRRRVPGTRLSEYLALLRLARAGDDARILDVMDGRSALFQRLWAPFAIAALNTEVETGSARCLYGV